MDKEGNKTGGRQKGSLNKETQQIKSIIDEVVDFKIVVGKLYELSQGVQCKTQKGVVYESAPDSNAAKILMEYRFGRPKQDISIDTPDDSTLTLEIVRKDSATNTTNADQ